MHPNNAKRDPKSNRFEIEVTKDRGRTEKCAGKKISPQITEDLNSA